jgi:hypothetical protein
MYIGVNWVMKPAPPHRVAQEDGVLVDGRRYSLQVHVVPGSRVIQTKHSTEIGACLTLSVTAPTCVRRKWM